MSNPIYDPKKHGRHRGPGNPVDPARCCVAVFGDWHRSQCSRKGRYEHEGRLYCKQHHPDTVAAKQAAFDAKHEAQRAKWRHADSMSIWREKGAALMEAIAAGHNDPRQAAREHLDAKPVLSPLPTSGDMK